MSKAHHYRALNLHLVFSAIALGCISMACAQTASSSAHHIGVEGDHFSLDDKPLQIFPANCITSAFLESIGETA